MSISELLSLFNEGRYNDAEELLKKDTTHLRFLFGSLIYNFRSKHEDAMQLIKDFEKQNVDNTDRIKLFILSAKLEGLYRLYDFEEFNRTISLAEQLISYTEPKDDELLYWESNVFLLKAYYLGLIGLFAESLENLHKVMEYYRRLGVPYLLARGYEAVGELYIEIRDYEKALEYFEIGLNKLKNLKYSLQRGYILTHIGIIQEKRGLLKDAEKTYMSGIEEFNKSEQPTKGYLCELHLGNLATLRGELDEAMNIFTRIYDAGIEHGYQIQQYLALFNIGLVHKRRGDYIKAEECLEKVLEFQLKLDNPINISDTLLELVKVGVYGNNRILTSNTMKKFQQFMETESNTIIELRFKLALALQLKNQSRLKDKLRGQQIFKDIVNDPSIEESDIRTIALVNLCDLAVFEIRSSHDASLLEEVYGYVEQIQKHAIQNRMVVVELEADFLKSKFYIAENRMNEGIELLNRVYEKSESLGIEDIKDKVFSEIQRIKEEVESIQNANASATFEEENMKNIEAYLNELSRVLR